MPPKPTEVQRGSGIEFYNIDFSLQHQLRLAGANVPVPIQTASMYMQYFPLIYIYILFLKYSIILLIDLMIQIAVKTQSLVK